MPQAAGIKWAVRRGLSGVWQSSTSFLETRGLFLSWVEIDGAVRH
ncbi:hypothetical protein RLO149_c039370 [Roseobacter litoralis Och 149]|uniref:Uncharacterized protein n=1 Tax=Roseobacter litoralis (strain ATCC 49566 / DSM 6996 / JCM 21268 / NBRC 15278 / OCh 149) TaxID=391595 RepID=F7ZDQ4_ROSLO|nr:hypothetical protein RLO149_c039370 [Roseobacter litoralis Och 149]